MPYFYGKNIMLRDYRQEDLPAIRAWVNDRDTIRYLSTRFWMPQSITDTSDFLNHAMSAGPNGAYFIVADLTDEHYLGQLDLFSINWRLRSAEMGMVIASEKNRGRGIGAEAIGLLQGVEGIGFVTFAEEDVVRHDLVRRIVGAYQAASQRERERVERRSPADKDWSP